MNMKTMRICPECRTEYEGEDYCPQDGARLLPTTGDEGGKPCPPGPVGGATDSDDSVRPRDSASGSGSEPASADREGRLASFISRLGLRPRTTGEETETTSPPATDASSEEVSPLPDDVLRAGWRAVGPVDSTEAADIWPVRNEVKSGQLNGIFFRYRTGSLSTVSVYRRLEVMTAREAPRVWAHGTLDLGGARADYDLISPSLSGPLLNKWFAMTDPSEQRALSLLPSLATWLASLNREGLQPISFDPAQIVRSDDGHLSLVAAGALAETSAMESLSPYRPEFARSALLSRIWAAPEVLSQTILSRNAAVFSAGQILAQAAWGQPCTHADLQAGAIPFGSIADPRLGRVLMGCLWPHPEGRWLPSDLEIASRSTSANELPGVPPWGSLAPGASKAAFSLGGESFWRLEDLLAASCRPVRWGEATARIGEILDWAESTAWVGLAKAMKDAQDQGRSPDWVLLSLSQAVRPDAPRTWRELDLSDQEAERSLISLAQRALKGDQAAAQTMTDLFEADLRGAFNSPPS
ncbi:hypothetical protein AAG895_17890 [Thauera sp. JM12B12]|uniref:hypothetical protein n=1 Tax=Thauera sp. JM12B12 TaxID=3142262 RepID=UPI0031F3DB47